MQVVSFCSQKGGTGKTTLVGHLAVQAELRGAGPVAMVDGDPQGSLAAWWESRASSPPALIRASISGSCGWLERLREQGFRLVLVDTPSGPGGSAARVIERSDLVVVPTRLGPHDRHALSAALEPVTRAAKPLMLVANGAGLGTRITKDGLLALVRHAPPAPVLLSQRTILASSMTLGRTVVETHPASRSAREIGELWALIENRLARLAKRQAFLQRRPATRFFGRRTIADETVPLEPVG